MTRKSLPFAQDVLWQFLMLCEICDVMLKLNRVLILIPVII